MDMKARSDGELLADFAAAGREASFEELVRRYQPLVFGTCLRVLGQPQDAEDAAQAVFLTLAHRARSLKASPSLAGWLYTLGRTISRTTRRGDARRKRREQEAGKMIPGSGDPRQARLRELVDEALEALPEKYRGLLLLHYWQQRTEEDIARETGQKVGTISMGLHRGRDLLRGRLARQGAVVSGAILSAVGAQEAAAAAVSPAFVASTAKAAALVAAGKAAGVSVSVEALVKGGLKAMMWAKVKIVTGAMAAATVMVGSGIAVVEKMRPEAAAVPQSVASRKSPAAAGGELVSERNFEQLARMIKPQPIVEESGIWEIPWVMDVWEARKKAAAEGKPMIYFTNVGDPLGTC